MRQQRKLQQKQARNLHLLPAVIQVPVLQQAIKLIAIQAVTMQVAAQVQQHPRTTEVLLPAHQEVQAAAYHIIRQDSPLLITHASLLAILMYGVVQARQTVLTVSDLS